MLTVAASSPVRWRGRIPRGFPDKFQWMVRIAAIAGGCNPPAPCGLRTFESFIIHQFMFPGSSAAECFSDKEEADGSTPSLGTNFIAELSNARSS